MKKLLLSSALSLCGVMAFGQLDLAITAIVSPANGTSVTDQQQVPSTFIVENTGTTTLSVNDTIYFRNELNGATQSYTAGGSPFNTFIYVLTKTLAPNDTVMLGTTLPTAWGNAGVVAGSSFTWGFNVRGTTCCPTVDDADLTNNVVSVTLNASGGTVGLEGEISAVFTKVYFSGNTLFVEGTNVSGATKVEVFNLSGQKVFENPVEGGSSFTEEFDLSHLNDGIYITKVSSGLEVLTSTKIIK